MKGALGALGAFLKGDLVIFGSREPIFLSSGPGEDVEGPLGALNLGDLLANLVDLLATFFFFKAFLKGDLVIFGSKIWTTFFSDG